jgi:U3 small nucleolar RNA-associated protein 18
MLESGKVETLKKGFLEYRKLKDMNHTTHNEGSVIRCAEFHPSAAVGLVAGNNGTASLFQIDGKFNPKMQSVHFENFPVKTAHFTSDGRQFLVGSQHFGHFFAYDMIKGKSIKVPWKEDKDQGSMQRFQVSPTNDLVAFHGRFGNIHVMSTRSRSKLFTLKMNDDVTALTFSPDGEYLYSHGAGGEVYIWDLKAQECVHKFVDDGCLRGTAITISRNNRYLSCGSDSGVVNVYRRQDVIANHSPTPEKIVLNLTTTVTSVKFNPTSEILAMTSEVKDNAVKLLHLPSMTVFANFPSFSYNFKRPNCIDFSLNGGYFSVGNNRGAANLYRY